jgi:V/A-type H+-transporting ATPase subunit K
MTFPRGFAPDTNTEEEEMNPKLMRNALRMMIVLLAVIGLTDVVAAAGADAALNGSGYSWGMPLGAGIALGLAGVGTGLSQGQIGAAAVGMVAEDGDKFVTGLIFTALPETIVLFGFLAMFLM